MGAVSGGGRRAASASARATSCNTHKVYSDRSLNAKLDNRAATKLKPHEQRRGGCAHLLGDGELALLQLRLSFQGIQPTGLHRSPN
jgi:hypothetical protein